MAHHQTPVEVLPKPHSPEGTEKLWQEFRKPHAPNAASPSMRARARLTQPPQDDARQFVIETGAAITC